MVRPLNHLLCTLRLVAYGEQVIKAHQVMTEEVLMYHLQPQHGGVPLPGHLENVGVHLPPLEAEHEPTGIVVKLVTQDPLHLMLPGPLRPPRHLVDGISLGGRPVSDLAKLSVPRLEPLTQPLAHLCLGMITPGIDLRADGFQLGGAIHLQIDPPSTLQVQGVISRLHANALPG